jgi:hypothetical protein
MSMDTTTDTSPQLSEQSSREKIFKILNLSVPILMGIFIFFNPFPHTTSIKEICFYGSVIIVLILIYFKKIDFSFRSPLTLPFALFTAWAFIGLFFALDKGNSLHDFRAHLLKYLVLYYILVNFFNSRKPFVGYNHLRHYIFNRRDILFLLHAGQQFLCKACARA